MKIESFEFDTQQHAELVPRSILQQVSDAATAAAKPPRRKRTDQTTVNGDKTAQTSVPASLVNEYGMVPDVMQVLEVRLFYINDKINVILIKYYYLDGRYISSNE
jgi:hypothetical protein